MTSALLFAFGIGCLLGFLITTMSAGGGILAVPLMQFVLGMTHTQAVATSLAGVLGAALVGVIGHSRAGRVHWRIAAVFAPAAMLGSSAGATLHALLPEAFTLTLFAGLLGAAAFALLRPAPSVPPILPRPNYPMWLVAGIGIGVLGGLFGIGGGFLFVPTLLLWVGMSMKHAVGTTTAIVLASSFSGAATYAFAGALDSATLVPVGIGAIVGALAGIPAVGRLPDALLRKVFAVFVACAGLAMLYRAWA